MAERAAAQTPHSELETGAAMSGVSWEQPEMALKRKVREVNSWLGFVAQHHRLPGLAAYDRVYHLL